MCDLVLTRGSINTKFDDHRLESMPVSTRYVHFDDNLDRTLCGWHRRPPRRDDPRRPKGNGRPILEEHVESDCMHVGS